LSDYLVASTGRAEARPYIENNGAGLRTGRYVACRAKAWPVQSTAGQTRRYDGKLLLGGFGGAAELGENLLFAKDEVLFVVELNFGAAVLAE